MYSNKEIKKLEFFLFKDLSGHLEQLRLGNLQEKWESLLGVVPLGCVALIKSSNTQRGFRMFKKRNDTKQINLLGCSSV